MNNFRWICALLLSLLLCTTVSQASEVARATFIFGKVEVLKSDSDEWDFLTRDIPLSLDDLIRMPPISLLRLTKKSGDALPAFYGSRERTIRQLIAEGEAKHTSTGRRLDADLDGTMAIDILPAGDPNRAQQFSSSSLNTSTENIQVNDAQLQHLRALLKQCTDAVNTYAREQTTSIPKETDIIQKRLITVYPGANILRAQHLFDALKTEMSTPTGESLRQHLHNAYSEPRLSGLLREPVILMILYGQLLHSVGIEVDFATNTNRELFLIFDSGIQPSEIKRITANQKLVYPHRRDSESTSKANNLWIPISMSSINNNFTYIWYKGASELRITNYESK